MIVTVIEAGQYVVLFRTDLCFANLNIYLKDFLF